MEAILVKEGVVINRVNVTSLEQAVEIFPNNQVVQDDNREYSIGDSYTE